MTEHDALRVWCRTCGAPAGERCRTYRTYRGDPGGRPTAPHAVRWRDSRPVSPDQSVFVYDRASTASCPVISLAAWKRARAAAS
jgi:hypothetical protein